MVTELIGYAAALSVLATFCMRTMLPLRTVALASNVLFAAYGLLAHLYPVLLLHAILFPVNLVRLLQIRRLVRSVGEARDAELPIRALLPLMRRRTLAAGSTLFAKGDAADRLYFLAEGRLRIVELDRDLQAGAVVGEIGLFTADERRTATAVCLTDCVLCELGAVDAKQLYFQDPSFGFALLRLAVARLVENWRRFERDARADAPAPLPRTVPVRSMH